MIASRIKGLWLLLCIVLLSNLPGAAAWAGTPVQSPASMRLWDLAASRSVHLAEILPLLAQTDLLIIGESHGNKEHHQAQLDIIKALHDSGTPVAVGLEMFQHREQHILDQWVAGEIREQGMIPAFARNWSSQWSSYREIFLFCRDHNLPMVGLNVPREITRKVARQGFASLTKEELGLLPPIVCRIDPEYEAFLRRFVGGDGHGPSFTRFCEAQLVWDAAMAIHALEFLRFRPEYTMVMLTGSVHAWKMAVPEQMRRLAPLTSLVSIIPEVPTHMQHRDATSADADYIIIDQ